MNTLPLSRRLLRVSKTHEFLKMILEVENSGRARYRCRGSTWREWRSLRPRLQGADTADTAPGRRRT
jgi:hypothetical protein